MGIPRLSSDLFPYAETAILGESKIPCCNNIDCIVIDGPSLVYHVYNRLIAYKNAQGASWSSILPSYTELNASLLRLLDDFHQRGITIAKIFFDGALPVAKRTERLKRLERTRQVLEDYRKLHGEPLDITATIEILDPAQAIWHEGASINRQQLQLHPPFMVPSAIEALSNSKWSAVTRVVPGEADPFCAGEAAISQAAVLTNDSDLALYDLGRNGRIINLNTLQCSVSSRDPALTPIKARVLCPLKIAARLQVSSVLRIGFQRSLDPSASTAITIERAKCQSDAEDILQAYASFRHIYASSGAPNMQRKYNATSLPSLDGLDPRIAELVCSCFLRENPHVYLPILFEDHNRDSSWAYGLDFRIAAYSIISLACSREADFWQQREVQEYTRRGRKVSSATLRLRNRADLGQSLAEIQEIFQKWHSLLSVDNSESKATLEYYLIAIEVVIQQRTRHGKQYKLPLHKLFGLDADVTASISWDDIHFVANIHAVLYSLRLLGQAVRFIAASCNDGLGLGRSLIELFETSNTITRIANLFSSASELSFFLRQTLSRELTKGPGKFFSGEFSFLTELSVEAQGLNSFSAEMGQSERRNQADKWDQSTQTRKRRRRITSQNKATRNSTNISKCLADKNAFGVLGNDNT